MAGAGAEWSALTLEVTLRLLEAEGRRLDSKLARCHGDTLPPKKQSKVKLGSASAALNTGPPKGIFERDDSDDAVLAEGLRLQYQQLEAEYARSTALLMGGAHRHRAQPALGIRVGRRRKSIQSRCGKENWSGGTDGDASSGVAVKRGAFRTELGGLIESNAQPRAPGKRGKDAVDHPDPLITAHGRVVSGSIDALVAHFIHRGSKMFNFTFVIVFRLFIEPCKLMSTLVGVLDSAAVVHPDTAAKFDSILRAWVTGGPADFHSSATRHQFTYVSDRLAAVSPASAAASHATQQLLKDRISAHETATIERRAELRFQKEHRSSETVGSTRLSTTEACGLFELGGAAQTPSTLARQLTFAEQRRFARVEVAEFVSTMADAEHAVAATNLRAYVDWWNRLSWLVATSVCQSTSKKARIRLLEHWISVGQECRSLQNYNSIIAIVAALNMSSIRRLEKTWRGVRAKSRLQMAQLEDLFDPAGNFLKYRREVAALAVTEPCIPFFSLVVKDVFFTQAATSVKRPDGRINWERFEPLAMRLAEFSSRKSALREIVPDGAIQEYLAIAVVSSELELYQRSLELEPADDGSAGCAMPTRKHTQVTENVGATVGASAALMDNAAAIPTPIAPVGTRIEWIDDNTFEC